MSALAEQKRIVRIGVKWFVLAFLGFCVNLAGWEFGFRPLVFFGIAIVIFAMFGFVGAMLLGYANIFRFLRRK